MTTRVAYSTKYIVYSSCIYGQFSRVYKTLWQFLMTFESNILMIHDVGTNTNYMSLNKKKKKYEYYIYLMLDVLEC